MQGRLAGRDPSEETLKYTGQTQFQGTSGDASYKCCGSWLVALQEHSQYPSEDCGNQGCA